ncbi:winged helix-turn-helix domain-containing protein [Candidatus Pelagibacter sp.]|uniref:winged helix-turn-helix domain-containing protein n=1 Tax=Candidatus Pelagibacter sp. TaxID=2024849 RepID=UPI003F83534A
MNSRILIIYENQILYQVLNEISESLNFEIIQSDEKNFKEFNYDQKNNYLIISQKKIEGAKNSLILGDLPIKFDKLIEIINIRFLRNKFLDQSYIQIGEYNLDLNSRKISLGNKSLDLTERETNLIIFIKDKKNVTVKELQTKVWDYSPDLDTHTVETHIYRLRKKMKETFGDESFILNTSNGYSID